ncbi:MAG: hypothetical protein Q4P08_00700 [Eubacteriales bacterium]|nr:hypothetical protein [Eubacteriales bacterium]
MGRLDFIPPAKKLWERIFPRRSKSHQENLREGLERQRKLEAQLPERRQDPVFNPFGRFAVPTKAPEREHSLQPELSPAEQIERGLKEIEVTAFIGPSGTGKSTRALRIARDEGIFNIIDDGILIHGSRIVAGSSAKRAETKLDSVRQAIFAEPVRAEIMRRALYDRAPEKLLVLGTSVGMVERICNNLGLEPPARQIMIEDVTTEEERMTAKSVRMMEGKHTIPVPSMEIKHEFSGYLSDPIMKLKRRFDRGAKEAKEQIGMPLDERTVVRPTFSALGTYSISDQAMGQMLDIELRSVEGVERLLDLQLDKEPYGVFLYLDLAIYYGYNAQQVLREAQQAAAICLEKYTAVNVLATNVRARRLVKLDAPHQSSVEPVRQ